MGADVSTSRLRPLLDEGFTVAEARLALEATSGNIQRAKELLIARRQAQERAQGGALAARANAFLRTQQPWDEFFGRFLWPEHLQERLSTNLLYYRANYAIVCSAIVGVGALQRPPFLLLLGISVGLLYVAAEWDGKLPAEWRNTPLRIEQRLTVAGVASYLLVQWMGEGAFFSRLAVICGGVVLGHAAFRARTLQARWAHFRENVEKQD